MRVLRKFIVFFFAAVVIFGSFWIVSVRMSKVSYVNLRPDPKMFPVQAIDTMKYSRDLARQELNNKNFDSVIRSQVKVVAEAGATHIALGTPYDEEFVPILARWIKESRAANLKVLFRGNFSGWEGWFGYGRINRETHTAKLKSFITNHPELFADGDVFMTCPECENGGPGDPRHTGDSKGYISFLEKEHQTAEQAFKQIGRQVASHFASMNGDVADLVISQGGLDDMTILVDHYVSTPEQFIEDLQKYREDAKQDVGIGEFGAPIPDLNGNLTQAGQASYVSNMMEGLYANRLHIPLLNYWVLTGGSTALLDQNGTKRQVYDVVKQYYTAPYLYGIVKNSLDEAIGEVPIEIEGKSYTFAASKDGSYQIFLPFDNATIVFGGNGYATSTISWQSADGIQRRDVVVEPIEKSIPYRIKVFMHHLNEWFVQK